MKEQLSSEKLSIKSYAQSCGILENDVWELVESGKVQCRMIGSEVYIYNPSPKLQIALEPHTPSLQSHLTHNHDAIDRLAKLEEKLSEQLDKQKSIEKAQEKIAQQSDLIRSLQRQLEDYKCLTMTLEAPELGKKSP